MNLFADIEKTIERGFRRFAERMFGPADSSELLLVHRAILEEIGGKVQTVARGQRVFPYPHVEVTLISADPDRRALYQTAFGDEGRLEKDVREVLEGLRCQIPRGFALQVRTAETGEGQFEIDFSAERKVEAPAPQTPGRLVVVKGKAAQAEYTLDRTRTNIGRMAELADSDERLVRRNDVVFEEGDEANATVSRKHAHIRREAGEYRICDDESQYGTRIFRDGRSIEVPAGNRRGEKLRPGDEIYLGRACLRFER
ncbi:MAG TPA: FHA domain-containing protein [Candidatus Sulfopaludibacter sp.]|nr:FHA domain-containing protein [Candidatus Sulfopaludibacter sp.]